MMDSTKNKKNNLLEFWRGTQGEYNLLKRTGGAASASSGATSIPLSGTSSEYNSDGLKNLGPIKAEKTSDNCCDPSRFQMAFLLNN